LLVPTGYLSNLVVAQTLAGDFSHALVDERAHASLQDAARLLECPILHFSHRNQENLANCIHRCGPGAKLILLTDGLFAHDGSVAPLQAYAKVLPNDALMWVDDAHGAGVLGTTGKGSLEHAGIGRERVIQTITLSKAFGTYGGAVLCTAQFRRRILQRSALFTGSTPLPLPLANAAITAVGLLRKDPGVRDRLRKNVSRFKGGLRAVGLSSPETPGPIVGLVPPDPKSARSLGRLLLQADVYAASILYSSASSRPYFRFAISSEHSARQLDQLQHALSQAGLAGW
jgi:7-keto-8-aminopelargonate synthetase-like enzyme